MRNFAKIQATYDFVVDLYENGDYLDDVHETVNDNLEDFLAMGCDPAKLADMMDPINVLVRADLFKGIDFNPTAKRLDSIDFEVHFEQLVDLGVKADAAREAVAEWDGDVIINHIAELLKCGFSKEELSDLLYKKIGDYGPSFDNKEYLDVVSTSEHLYTFLSRECLEYAGDGSFYAGCYECTIPFDVAALIEHGADKDVISRWIANQMIYRIFNENLQKELHKYGVFPSEEQIVCALSMRDDGYIHDWMSEEPEPNPNFMAFMNDSENPHDLISKLDDISDCAITDYCEYYCYSATKDYIMRFPNFWKNAVILFLEAHGEGMYDELCCSLQILDWLQIGESEWKKVLSGHKEWIEECIEEAKNDPDYWSEEEVVFLNKLVSFAS